MAPIIIRLTRRSARHSADAPPRAQRSVGATEASVLVASTGLVEPHVIGDGDPRKAAQRAHQLAVVGHKDLAGLEL